MSSCAQVNWKIGNESRPGEREENEELGDMFNLDFLLPWICLVKQCTD